MKTLLLSSLAASAGFFLTSCDGQPVASATAASRGAVLEEAAAPAGPAAPALAEEQDDAGVEAEIAKLKAEEATLRLEMQQDQLASVKADLERQRQELEDEKAALAATAAGQPAVKTNGPSVRRAEPADEEAPAAGGRDYQMFYEGLAPYGRWMETPEYGYVWQPASGQPAGWRPYTIGRWADSDQGWTWISDEPFGWATYHYGRWALLENRSWIWVPGDTWAPAWVSWRNNADLVGWSPLPPETVYAEDIDYGPSVDEDYSISPDSYIFMPVRYFDEPVNDYCYPALQNTSYFSATIGITHLVIRSGNVNCGGPERLWVNRYLSRPMTRYRLDRGHDWSDRRDYRPHILDGRLSCYSPEIRAPWNDGIRPARLQGRLDNIKIVRRQDIYRGELGRRYQEEQQQRRNRATASLQQDSVRRLADRHGEFEKIRSRRDQLSQRSQDDEHPREKPQKQDRPDSSGIPDVVRGNAALQNAKLEAARKELKDRQEQIARLRQQRDASNPKSKSDEPGNSREAPANRDNPSQKDQEEANRRNQAKQNEARQREQEANQRGQREDQAKKDQEEANRRNQAKQNDARQREQEANQRGQRENQAKKDQEEANRRNQAKQNEARQRDQEANQRGQRENQAKKDQEEASRRNQAKQNEARQRDQEANQRGQRENQAKKDQEEASRRNQAKQNEARQRDGDAKRQAEQQRSNQERQENARRGQARQNEQRQKESPKPKKPEDNDKPDKKRGG